MADKAPRTPPKAPAVLALIALVGPAMYVDLRNDTRADEGERSVAYRDLGGVWTICDGTTRGVKAGQKATPEECDSLTAADLVVAVKGVERCSPALKDPARHQQLRAAVRFSNNVGLGAFCRGWWKNRPSVARLINAGQWRSAGLEMLRYDLIKGRPSKGLHNRRSRESAMFLDGLPPPAARADFPVCVRVNPGPLKPRRRPPLNPHNSEIV